MQQNLTSPIRVARTAAGLSQDGLAERVGVSKSSVSAWEAGKEFPASTRLAVIARSLEPHFDLDAYVRWAERAREAV